LQAVEESFETSWLSGRENMKLDMAGLDSNPEHIPRYLVMDRIQRDRKLEPVTVGIRLLLEGADDESFEIVNGVLASRRDLEDGLAPVLDTIIPWIVP